MLHRTLAGQAPATFQLPPGDWQSTAVPAIPVGLPSDLLQRRPDIAAAERAVAAANAQIGIQRAGYFPSLTLSASLGNSTAGFADLFNVSTALWSIGVSVALTAAVIFWSFAVTPSCLSVLMPFL